MIKYFLTLFIISTLFNCNWKDGKSETIQNNIKIKSTEFSNIQSEIILKNLTVLVYEPSDKSIEVYKKKSGEENFYIAADDYLFYLNSALKYLDSQKIKVIFFKNDKILKFISTNKDVTIIKLKNEDEIWGMYFFDPKQKPKRVDMTSIELEFNDYFKR